jgi:hypothetical protein
VVVRVDKVGGDKMATLMAWLYWMKKQCGSECIGE